MSAGITWHRAAAALALAGALAGCAGQQSVWTMTDGQRERALHRMALTECHARARAAVGSAGGDELERVAFTHACMRQFE